MEIIAAKEIRDKQKNLIDESDLENIKKINEILSKVTYERHVIILGPISENVKAKLVSKGYNVQDEILNKQLLPSLVNQHIKISW